MNNITSAFLEQKLFFENGKTKDLSFRIEMLKKLKKIIIDNEATIMDALKKDLNKSSFESYASEIGFILEEISYTIKHLPKWIKNKKVRTPLAQFISKSYIYSEPYGVTLIMAPWNYPFQLAIGPLIGSISAGNCSIIKPSEYSPYTSEVLYKIISENFDPKYISVVLGELDVNITLLNEPFDYIFFTGSPQVGKIVMEAASKHLTPVTLELGGKSPCIIDETANIELAAKRIVWGKFLNAGQTCVAPDYLLVQSSVKEKLIAAIKKYIIEMYSKDPCTNDEYVKIINERHFNRLVSLFKNEKIAFGGNINTKTLQIAPTLLDNVTWDSPIMKEEIFGPILPILEFENIQEVIKTVNKHPKPLALYLFTTNKNNENTIIKNISYGGGCINDTLVHIVTPHMPFGGVGNSGMGGYHGRASFDTFSHKKSILKKSNLLDIPLRYPPYKNNLKLLKKIMK